MKKSSSKDYLKTLKKRKGDGKNRVTRSHQFTGLNIAETLNDQEHKSLYIKLAKEHDESTLFKLAKDVAERKNVKNRGAYFMSLIKKMKEEGKL